MNSERPLDISWGTILRVGVAALGFYLIYLIRDTLILVIFALIISVLFGPLIDFLRKRKVPHVLATTLVFLAVFGFLGFSVYLISLTFIFEIRQFTVDFPQHFERFSPVFRDMGLEAFEDIEAFMASLERWLKGASENILAALSTVFGGLFSAVFIFFLAFFFSLEEKGAERALKVLFPKKYEDLALEIWAKSRKKITGWFGVRILSCIFVGLTTFIVLKVFSVDYAASMGLFAGITNIILYLGPVFAGIVITFLVLIESLPKAIFVLIAFVLIQQIEGNILSPILTKKFIGLPPALVLIALIAGGELFGFLGVLLAIPLAGILFDFLTEFLEKRKMETA